MKSGNLNFLEPSGPLQACNGTDLPLPYIFCIRTENVLNTLRTGLLNCLNACSQGLNFRPATSSVHYTTNCNTQSSAPEDGQNNFPKHVELTGIINKPLLLHLVGCLYYLYK